MPWLRFPRSVPSDSHYLLMRAMAHYRSPLSSASQIHVFGFLCWADYNAFAVVIWIADHRAYFSNFVDQPWCHMNMA